MKKILLIEDDTIVRENTAEILQLANYEIVTAINGKDGVEKAMNHKPDLIICDILMPELDGYGVLQILMRNKGLQKTPFIFMTAKTNHSDMRRGMDLGASDYITKPFEESELLSAIESRLKKRAIFKKRDKESETYIKENVNFDNLEIVFKDKEKFIYSKNETIFCKGNSSNFIFYIVDGEVKTYKTNQDGKELIIGIFKKNDFFGFTSFAHNNPYHENAVAIKTTTLYKIRKSEVFDLVKRNPQLAINFMDLLTDSLKDLKDKLIHIAYDTVRGKTAETLLTLYAANEKRSLIITRYNLANLIGVAKETLIRTLTEFRDENLIETNRNSIRIIDEKGLKEVK
ncbi:MAG: response regulator [Bacteroidota bacterium]